MPGRRETAMESSEQLVAAYSVSRRMDPVSRKLSHWHTEGLKVSSSRACSTGGILLHGMSPFTTESTLNETTSDLLLTAVRWNKESSNGLRPEASANPFIVEMHLCWFC
jgi:hypothetical protein